MRFLQNSSATVRWYTQLNRPHLHTLVDMHTHVHARSLTRWLQTTRRRSSVVYNPGAAANFSQMAVPEDGPMPGGPENVDNMTPQEIEEMIQRLQVRVHACVCAYTPAVAAVIVAFVAVAVGVGGVHLCCRRLGLI